MTTILLIIVLNCILSFLFYVIYTNNQLKKKNSEIGELNESISRLKLDHQMIEERFMDEILSLEAEIAYTGGVRSHEITHSFPTHGKILPLVIKSQVEMGDSHQYQEAIKSGYLYETLYRKMADEIVKSLKENKSFINDVVANHNYGFRRILEAKIYIEQRDE